MVPKSMSNRGGGEGGGGSGDGISMSPMTNGALNPKFAAGLTTSSTRIWYSKPAAHARKASRGRDLGQDPGSKPRLECALGQPVSGTYLRQALKCPASLKSSQQPQRWFAPADRPPRRSRRAQFERRPGRRMYSTQSQSVGEQGDRGG